MGSTVASSNNSAKAFSASSRHSQSVSESTQAEILEPLQTSLYNELLPLYREQQLASKVLKELVTGLYLELKELTKEIRPALVIDLAPLTPEKFDRQIQNSSSSIGILLPETFQGASLIALASKLMRLEGPAPNIVFVPYDLPGATKVLRFYGCTTKLEVYSGALLDFSAKQNRATILTGTFPVPIQLDLIAGTRLCNSKALRLCEELKLPLLTSFEAFELFDQPLAGLGFLDSLGIPTEKRVNIKSDHEISVQIESYPYFGEGKVRYKWSLAVIASKGDLIDSTVRLYNRSTSSDPTLKEAYPFIEQLQPYGALKPPSYWNIQHQLNYLVERVGVALKSLLFQLELIIDPLGRCWVVALEDACAKGLSELAKIRPQLSHKLHAPRSFLNACSKQLPDRSIPNEQVPDSSCFWPEPSELDLTTALTRLVRLSADPHVESALTLSEHFLLKKGPGARTELIPLIDILMACHSANGNHTKVLELANNLAIDASEELILGEHLVRAHLGLGDLRSAMSLTAKLLRTDCSISRDLLLQLLDSSLIYCYPRVGSQVAETVKFRHGKELLFDQAAQNWQETVAAQPWSYHLRALRNDSRYALDLLGLGA